MPIEDIIHPYLARYTAAPQLVKTVLGGIYTRLPARVRYGAAYGGFAQEIERCERDPVWTAQRAQEKLMQTLQWAIKTVPAYAQHEGLLGQDLDPQEILAHFGTIDKANFKTNEASFLSTAMGPETRLVTYTGGSTSVPMRLYIEKFVSRSRDFAYNTKFDRVSGVAAGDLILAMRGRTVPGSEREDGPIWMFDPIKRYVHLSTDYLEPRHMHRYVAAWRRFRPRHMHVYPSAIVPLANWLAANPHPDLTDAIESIQLFSENVYDYQIDLIKKVFKCPILTDYGHSERCVKAISTRTDKRLFFWPLYGHVELLGRDGKFITEPGIVGEVVGTGFDNKVMPLIRYRTGDLAAWSTEPNTSRPGFKVIDSLDGRLQEFLVTHDYRLISVATVGAAHFEQLAAADRMQFEQMEPGKAVLKILAERDLASDVKAQLAHGIAKQTQGGIAVEVVRVEELKRTSSGKHKLLIQHLDLSGYMAAAHIDSED